MSNSSIQNFFAPVTVARRSLPLPTNTNPPGSGCLAMPTHLLCEYFDNPLGLDELHPRLSWQLNDPRRGARQIAHQILVASSPELLEGESADLWNPGRVCSNQSVHIEYEGIKLRARQRCYWKVRIWNEQGQISQWSETALWEMGLLKRSDWQAEWIASVASGSPAQSEPCPHLRKPFSLRGLVAQARLYVTALGLYEIWLNGRRVGSDHFTPGWTDYHIRTQYQTYDVTAMLQQGDNVLGAILGDGWHSGYLVWENNRNVYGDTPLLLAQLVVEYADGRTETVSTDDSWKCATGAILASDIYHGETYDARREMSGWNESGFDDHNWKSVIVPVQKRLQLNASASPRVRKVEDIQPVVITEPQPGVFVFDLGQNMTGWARLRVAGGSGTTVTLRFSEVLNPDGSVYTTNLRTARCTDQYTLKGGDAETYEPRFTFHGFRYVEVTGYPGTPGVDAITGVVLHSNTPPTGTFECSNPMLNQLQHNIQWGQKGNFLDVPTDCPQRDERLGWTGDAQVFIRTAAFNADVSGFFTKWLTDLTDAQTPLGTFPRVAPDVLRGKGILGPYQEDGGAAWADAGVICPWMLYLCYGDKRILERQYASMTRYVEFLQSVDHRARHGFGDWLNYEDHTPKDLISFAFSAHSTHLMARVAGVLGKQSDEKKFQLLLKQLKTRFQEEFLTTTGRLVGDSQTALVLALQFDLVPDSLRMQTATRLVERIRERNDHLTTGFVGTPHLLFALEQSGHLDLAYKLLLNEDFPSWGYPIKHGATSMWERWDGWRHDTGLQDPHMNSFNHYAYGAVGEWLYRCVAGLDIDPAEPGYKHILIHPRPGGSLTHAKASYASLYGRIAIQWRSNKDKFTLDAMIPANTWATLTLPCALSDVLTESGQMPTEANGVTDIRRRADHAICRLDSGLYHFECTRNATSP